MQPSVSSALLCVVLAALAALGEGGVSCVYGEQTDDRSAFEKAEEGEQPKKEKVLSFSRYRPLLRALCDGVEGDGRRERLQNLVTDAADVESECKNCRSFLKTFASACKPLNKTKPKEGEGAPPERPKQREPHLKVVDSASVLFRMLAEDPKRSEAGLEVVQSVIELLRDSSSFSPAEKEYFDILAEYVRAPFADKFEVPVDHKPVGSSSVPPHGDVKDLFEF